VACTARAGAGKMQGRRRKQNEASKQQTGWMSAGMTTRISQSINVCYKETLRGPAYPMQARGPNPPMSRRCISRRHQPSSGQPQVVTYHSSQQATCTRHKLYGDRILG
jgi:hypothetical protein